MDKSIKRRLVELDPDTADDRLASMEDFERRKCEEAEYEASKLQQEFTLLESKT